MFAVIGTEAKRLGRSSWTEILSVFLVAGILTLAAALFVATVAGIFPPKGNTRPTTITAPAVAPAVTQPQVQAPASEPVAPVLAEWPKLHAEWGKAFFAEYGSDALPFWGRYLEGFYSGIMPGSPTAEQNEYCFRILRGYEFAGKDGVSCMVAAAKDPVDKNIVFASLWVNDSRKFIIELKQAWRENRALKYRDGMDKLIPFLFLSMDGEKTWIEINLAPLTPLASVHHSAASSTVAVEKRGNMVYLFARDNTVAPMFFPAVVEIID